MGAEGESKKVIGLSHLIRGITDQNAEGDAPVVTIKDFPDRVEED